MTTAAQTTTRLEQASEPGRELFEDAYIACHGPVDWEPGGTAPWEYKNGFQYMRRRVTGVMTHLHQRDDATISSV